MTAATQTIRRLGLWTWILANRQRWWIRQLPNSLTLIRIGVPFCVVASYHAYRGGALGTATAWMALAGVLTLGDVFDGPLARVLQAESNFGRLADPALDKLVSASLLVCYGLALSAGLHNAIMLDVCLAAISLILLFELALALMPLGAVWLKRRGVGFNLGANRWGKLKFRWSCIGMAAGYVLLYWGGPQRLWTSSISLTLCLMVASVCAALSIKGHLRQLL